MRNHYLQTRWKPVLVTTAPPHRGHQTKIDRIMPVLKRYNVDKSYSTVKVISDEFGGSAYASIKDQKVIGQGLPAHLGIQPRHMEVRHWINIINNFFLKHDQTIEPDLQLNGANFSGVPNLITPDKIKAAWSYHVGKAGEAEVKRMLGFHALFWKELTIDTKETYANISTRVAEFKKAGLQKLEALAIWLQGQDEKRLKHKSKENTASAAGADDASANSAAAKAEEKPKQQPKSGAAAAPAILVAGSPATGAGATAAKANKKAKAKLESGDAAAASKPYVTSPSPGK